MIWSATTVTIDEGMAKPMPSAPDWSDLDHVDADHLAVALASAPPELPGLIGVSVWMRPK